MKPLLKTQRARLGALLDQQEAAARSTLDRAVGLRNGEPRNEPAIPDSGDADRAYAEQVIDRDLALAEHSARELETVAKARSRLGANTYGVCVGCCADIAFERLIACPTATRCERCQTLYEHTHEGLSHPSM